MGRRTLILSPERVHRTLRRMAYEVVERNQGSENLQVIGILQKGKPLARALARHIEAIENRSCPVHTLDVTPFRDDIENNGNLPTESAKDLDVTDRDVILVDDVLFTGRTTRAALGAVVTYGRPRSIQLAVLVDRGHREYPIQPDYTGRSLPTKHRERIEVVQHDSSFEVYVTEPEA